MNLPSSCVVLLVGPGASGKSTWAAAHFAPDAVVSSDRLRALVGTGENDYDRDLGYTRVLFRLLTADEAHRDHNRAVLSRWLDKWVRDHTTNRFGPVREVSPELVLEIAFDGIARSTRHKSGLAMRFPRINRIRTDKPAAEADTIDNLLRLVPLSTHG